MKYVSLLFFCILSCQGDGKDTPPSQQELKHFAEQKRSEFVKVEGGLFQMGDTILFDTIQFGKTLDWYGELLKKPDEGETYSCWICSPDSKIPHDVQLDAFYISKYEVSWADFDFYSRANALPLQFAPWTQDPIAEERKPNYPAGTRGWDDANHYCQWLGKILKVEADLPTEAQWEYAARSRGKHVPFATNTGLMDLGVNMGGVPRGVYRHYSEIKRAYPIDHFPPNPLGLYAMSGNNHEWVRDWYDKDYYKKSPKINPQGPAKGTHKMRRGGGENQDHYYNNVFDRFPRLYKPSKDTVVRAQDGFRCVINSKNL